MNRQWTRLYTQALDNPVVARMGATALGVLSWMLIHADDNGRLELSIRDAASKLKMPYRALRSVLEAFEKDGAIITEGCRSGTVVQFGKWSSFQGGIARQINNCGAKPAQNPRKTRANNQLECNDLNAKPAQNPRKTRAKPAQSTQENWLQNRIDKNNTPSPLPPAGDSAAGPLVGLGYPVSFEEVVKAAMDIGYSMTETEARQWLQMKKTSGWKDSAGAPIVSWRRMLEGFCRSAGIQTCEEAMECQDSRRREYAEVHERSVELIEKYGG